jgi:hypothetical protein
MEDDVADFLEHYGIKGQQWGVRHKPKPKLSIDDVMNRKGDPTNKQMIDWHNRVNTKSSGTKSKKVGKAAKDGVKVVGKAFSGFAKKNPIVTTAIVLLGAGYVKRSFDTKMINIRLNKAAARYAESVASRLEKYGPVIL